MAGTWDELAAGAAARQFPSTPGDDPAALLARVGPVQSQTARSPFVGLAARAPGITHAAVSAAYDAHAVVRGSTIRGTVHTATPHHFAALQAATALGQRTLWQRELRLEHGRLDDLWAATEAYAAGVWRTPDELAEHLHGWVAAHEGPDAAARVAARPGGRYLAFGHGGLVRRPVTGAWSGQGATEYTALAALLSLPDPAPGLGDVLLLHLRCHGPASRHDLAWWSGLGLRVVDEVLEGLDLTREPGPDGRDYLDVPDVPAGALPGGVRLLPEFDALLCAYEPSARTRFVDPEHHRVLTTASNGLILPPLLVDGRITGHWRLTGAGRRRHLEVTWFARTRRPRRAEVDEAATALATGLDVEIDAVSITRA